MKPIAIAVVEHDGRFLVGRRPEGVPLAGYWEFPGGKVQPGETPQQAAARECLEETGLAIDVGQPYPVVEYQYDHGGVRLHFFACRARPPVTPRSPFIWVTLSELSGLIFPPANAPILELLLARDESRDRSTSK